MPLKLVQTFNTMVKASGLVGIILFVWSINHFVIKSLVTMAYIGNVPDKWHLDFDAFE